MKSLTMPALAAVVLVFAVQSPAQAAPTEVKGAAILDHACGKTSVKHMGLVHAGKMAEAVKLGTKEMQDQWTAMSEADRTMMSGMMKDMSFSEADFSARIKAHGLLVVDGNDATLTVKDEQKSDGGSNTSTMTQKFKIDGGACRISR